METIYKDNIIIGAGQSGLSIAHYFEKDKCDYLILEKNTVASTWKKHYDSLKLITPNPFISLAGNRFNSPNKFPTKDEVVQYLTNYAEAFKENLKLNTTVHKIGKKGDLYTIIPI